MPPQGGSSAAPPSGPLDAWGRPALDFDPAANLVALARSSARLKTWLGVLLTVFLVSGVASALALFLGGRAGLKTLASLTQTPLPASAGWLLGLAALLSLALTAVYLGVIAWARELLSRLAAWALGATPPQLPSPDAARIERLRRTLSGWLTFGQWGTVLGVLLSAALVPISLELSRRLAAQFDPTAGGGLSDLGPGFEAFQTGASLVSAIPAVVIVWLILGAIRRFMTLSVERARGVRTAPVTPAARTVGNWFLLCLILLGLQLLNLLVVVVVLAVFIPVMRQSFAVGLPQTWQSLIGPVAGGLVGVLIFSALLLGLYFALLLFSRSYALALARQLDLAAAPPPPPPTALPTGSAGENPNIYRGQI